MSLSSNTYDTTEYQQPLFLQSFLFPPTTFECLRVSSNLGNQFKICLSYLLLIFWSRFSFNASSESSWKLLQTLPERGMEALFIHRTGLEALNSSSTSKARAEQSPASVCSLSRTTFDNYHLFFWRVNNMEKTKEFTFLFIRGWIKNSKTQFIYGTTIWWQQLPATLLNRPGWKPTALKWMASHYQITELSNPKQNSILKT